jgi:hypothetical protein
MQKFQISRALGLSFKAWFTNFLPFTLLAAVLYSPIVLWLVAYDGRSAGDADALVNAFFLRPVYLLTAISTLLSPMLTYRVVQNLNGIKVSMLTSVRFGLRGIVPAVMLAVMTHLLAYVPMAGPIVNAVLCCIWFVVTPVAVAERLSPFAAFSRSAELTAGRRWGIFGLSLLVGLAAGVLMLVWIIPMLQQVDDPAAALHQLERGAILFVITIGVFQLFNGIVQAVAYALLRQDKDGVSYEELAKIFE